VREIARKFDGRLNTDERNLLSVAYKNTTNALRNSWRVLEAVEKMESQSGSRNLELVRLQRERIERELVGICNDLMNLLDARLVAAAKPGEETVFYLKMSAFSSHFSTSNVSDLSIQESGLLSLSGRIFSEG
jgi:14-3-3 protein epsilon